MTKKTNQPSPIVFFGTEDFSARSLEALIANGFNVVAVVTKPDSARGRNRQLSSPLVKQIADEHKIAVLQPNKLDDDFIEQLTKTVEHRSAVFEEETLSEVQADKSSETVYSSESSRKGTSMQGVLVSYGKILPKSVLNLFPDGIINVHPSLLPKYRGPSPIESAILNGDEQTGVTIMRLSEEMDAGPLYQQRTHLLNGAETKPELYNDLANLGAQLLVETLPSIQSGQLLPVAQDDEHATYCSLLNKNDGLMDPEHKTAERLEREVRAYLGYPKSRIIVGGHEIVVTDSAVVNEQKDDALVITCKDSSLLEITGLIAPSGRYMSGQDFRRGYLK